MASTYNVKLKDSSSNVYYPIATAKDLYLSSTVYSISFGSKSFAVSGDSKVWLSKTSSTSYNCAFTFTIANYKEPIMSWFEIKKKDATTASSDSSFYSYVVADTYWYQGAMYGIVDVWADSTSAYATLCASVTINYLYIA